MNEQELGKEIARLLDAGANETIKQSTLYRLQAARRAALENCQPTLEMMNSGNGTSVFGGHNEHFNAGKLLLLVAVLVTFALVSATYWQFLERNRLTTDTTILVDDLSADGLSDNEPKLIDELSIDTYIDNVLQLVEDISAEVLIANEPIPEEIDDSPANVQIESEPELIEDLPTEARADSELDEKLDP